MIKNLQCWELEIRKELERALTQEELLTTEVEAKASTCPVNKTSLAERITLSKLVLSAIPLYMMQSMRLPKRIWVIWTRLEESLSGETIMREKLRPW